MAIDNYMDLLLQVKDLSILESFISDVDGKDMTHWIEQDGQTVGLDEGTCDASDAVAALNSIIGHLRRMATALNKRDAEHLEPPVQ